MEGVISVAEPSEGDRNCGSPKLGISKGDEDSGSLEME